MAPSTEARTKMQPGDIIAGKYRLNLPLGSGGMAEVWSATNTFTERQLAIKFMNPEVAKTPEAALRFLNEAKVSARVNHPNIIDILDVGQTEHGQLFLVMELLAGFSLEVALRRQTPPMTIHEFAVLMIEVGGALAAAHESGIVHRDLKPTNIYLHKLKDGIVRPKLLDFGVSKFLEEDTNHALTVAGTVLGSPLYMSPEQARGESNLDGRTDIFAFGVILFEALSGYRPYEAKNFNALIVKIATTKPKSIDTSAAQMPESLRRVVRACMETDLTLRAQTFGEVIALLTEALPELEASGLRLPMPLIATAVVDPDATHALPLRSSDRPQALGHDTAPGMRGSMIGSGSIPPGAIGYPSLSLSSGPSGSSWQTPNTSYASVAMTPPRKRNPVLMVAAGAALVLGGIGIGAVTKTSPRAAKSASAIEESQTSGGTVTTTAADQVEGRRGNASGTSDIPKGKGRLSLAASPGGCTITIDGIDRGATPLFAIDLAAGPHQVWCNPDRGKPRSATVGVQDGTTSKYRFALDD